MACVRERERLSECVYECVSELWNAYLPAWHGDCLMRYWLAIESIDFDLAPVVCERVFDSIRRLEWERESGEDEWVKSRQSKRKRAEKREREKEREFLWRIVVWHFSWLPMPCTDTPILTLHLSPGASDSLAWVPCASLDSPSWQARKSPLQRKKILVTSDASVSAQSNLR